MEPDARLAPVTYLPGVQPPSVPSEPASAEPALPDPALPDSALPDSALPEPALPDLADELAAEFHRAENVSLHALTRRGQSRRELERVLRSRDFSDEVIGHEVERLERVGLIDDIALAQNLVGSLQERKGLGRTGIAAELTRRLLSPAAIEYALELVDTGDELARARQLAAKRAPQLASYDRVTAERRLAGYLARRGYSGSTVRAAVDHALSARPATGVRFR